MGLHLVKPSKSRRRRRCRKHFHDKRSFAFVARLCVFLLLSNRTRTNNQCGLPFFSGEHDDFAFVSGVSVMKLCEQASLSDAFYRVSSTRICLFLGKNGFCLKRSATIGRRIIFRLYKRLDTPAYPKELGKSCLCYNKRNRPCEHEFVFMLRCSQANPNHRTNT